MSSHPQEMWGQQFQLGVWSALLTGFELMTGDL